MDATSKCKWLKIKKSCAWIKSYKNCVSKTIFSGFIIFNKKKMTMNIKRHYITQLQRKYNKVQDVKQNDNKERE